MDSIFGKVLSLFCQKWNVPENRARSHSPSNDRRAHLVPNHDDSSINKFECHLSSQHDPIFTISSLKSFILKNSSSLMSSPNMELNSSGVWTSARTYLHLSFCHVAVYEGNALNADLVFRVVKKWNDEKITVC